MTAPMTQEQIDEGERLCERSSKGPWKLFPAWSQQICDGWEGSSAWMVATIATNTYRDEGRHNAEWILWSRNNAPAIFATIRALQARAQTAAEERDSLLAELERERARAEAGARDSARLDHVFPRAVENQTYSGRGVVKFVFFAPEGKSVGQRVTLREAIDAALAQEAGRDK